MKIFWRQFYPLPPKAFIGSRYGALIFSTVTPKASGAASIVRLFIAVRAGQLAGLINSLDTQPR